MTSMFSPTPSPTPSPMTVALPDALVEPAVRAALAEDLGSAGDITSRALFGPEHRSRFTLVAREDGVLSGTQPARLAWHLLDPGVTVDFALKDGASLHPGAVIGGVEGPTRSLLSGERVALNHLDHLSGIATATRSLVDAVAHTEARIADTRKTTPGLRALEKDAVRHGGVNHRFGLDDAVMIKDNHIAAVGGVREAIERVRRAVGHLVAVEVEVDSLEQLDDVLASDVRRADCVLLDNMTPEQLREAVRRVAGRMTTEASGGITVESIAAVAESGVDAISSGWITHSAPCLDIGLDAI